MSVVQTEEARAHAERVAAQFAEGTVEHQVGLFHDHLEDDLGDVPEEIERHVLVLTRRTGESYSSYINRVKLSGDPIAIAVKKADLRDNIERCRGMHGGVSDAARAVHYTKALHDLEEAEVAASEKRVKRAIQTAKEAVHADPGLRDIKVRRFHRVMDALQPGEGERVYLALRDEPWFITEKRRQGKNAAAGVRDFL